MDAGSLMSCDYVNINLYMSLPAGGRPTYDSNGIINYDTQKSSVASGNGPNDVTHTENTKADMSIWYKSGVVFYQYVCYVTRQCNNIQFTLPAPGANQAFSYQLP